MREAGECGAELFGEVGCWWGVENFCCCWVWRDIFSGEESSCFGEGDAGEGRGGEDVAFERSGGGGWGVED